MVRTRLLQTCLLAMLMVIGQVIPSHGTRCEGCLMHLDGPMSPSSNVPDGAPKRCELGCCGQMVENPKTHSDTSNAPCGDHDSSSDGKCNCPGACCSTGQVCALARFATYDLSLIRSVEPVVGSEARVCARDASLMLLRPPRF